MVVVKTSKCFVLFFFFFYLSCHAWKNSKGDVYDKIEYFLAFLFLKGSSISIAYKCSEWCEYVKVHNRSSTN